MPRLPKSNFQPMHLTVTHGGLVSLWDSERDARHIATEHEPNESYIKLTLTPDQQKRIKDAAGKAAQ